MPDRTDNQGYVIPATAPSNSESASVIRAAAIIAGMGSYQLKTKPRAVIDQHDLPCCVSCALSSAMETMSPATPALSPLFHYYVTRFDNGGASSDGFLYLDDGLDTLTGQGICSASLHTVPFSPVGASTRPSAQAYADALTRALGRVGVRLRYRPLGGPSRVADIRDELKQEHPVVIGIRLPTGYPKSFLNSRFEWLDPVDPPLSLSGHCLLVVGYNDARGLLIQDSHGSSAFDGGLWWMGYRVADGSVIQDAYSLLP